MVQPAEHWHRYDLAWIRADLPRCWNRDALTKALMGAARVEISESELSENAVQLPLPKDDHVIEALPRPRVLARPRGVAGWTARTPSRPRGQPTAWIDWNL
jgi:hypothetical protein